MAFFLSNTQRSPKMNHRLIRYNSTLLLVLVWLVSDVMCTSGMERTLEIDRDISNTAGDNIETHRCNAIENEGGVCDAREPTFDLLSENPLKEIKTPPLYHSEIDAKTTITISLFTLSICCFCTFLLVGSLCFISIHLASINDALTDDNIGGKSAEATQYVDNMDDNERRYSKLDDSREQCFDLRDDDTDSLEFDKDDESLMSLPSDDEETLRIREQQVVNRLRASMLEARSSVAKDKQHWYRDRCEYMFKELKSLLDETPRKPTAVLDLVKDLRKILSELYNDFNTASGRITAMTLCCNKVLELEGLDLLQEGKSVAEDISIEAQAIIEILVSHIWGM